MEFGDYVLLATAKLECVVRMCSMYQIVTRTGVVSWDSACLNVLANFIQLATFPTENLLSWRVVSRCMCAVVPTIVVLLLLKYPPRTAYYRPYWLCWPVLSAGSATLSWTAAQFSQIPPWYFFVVFTDLFTSFPQGYIIVKMGGKTDNLTIGLFFLMFLVHTINGLYFTVSTDFWFEPHVMGYWTHILIMCIPFVRFYVERGRVPQCIFDIV